MTPERMADIHAAAFTSQRPWTADEFRTLLATPHIFEITRGSSCFALGRIVAGEAELLTIATHPKAQRQGLARDCLDGFIRHVAETDGKRVLLEVDALNDPAIALYHQFGFAESGRRTGYYRHPDGRRVDALLMALDCGN